MKKPVVFILLLLILVPVLVLQGQPYYFKHYEVENGLSTNTIYSSLIDRRGFLWFGTVDGLNRFDGYNFRVFRPERADNESTGNEAFLSLCQDPSGRLWAGTDKGLYLFDQEKETFHRVKGTWSMGVNNLSPDPKGNLWFMASGKLYRYEPQVKRLTLYQPATNIDVACVTVATEGTVWFASSSGWIYKFNPFTRRYSPYNVFSHSQLARSHFISRVFNAGDRYLLIGTSNQGVKLFDKTTGDYKDVLTYNKNKTELYVRGFVHYKDDEYWVATELGIFIYNLKTGKTVNLVKDNNNPYSLSDNAVYTLLRDREGGIWAGTFFGGLNYYPKQYNLFEKFFPTNSPGSLSGNAVREICKDQYGNLWIGTEDAGLNKFNPRKGTFTHYTTTGAKTDISYTNIHGLLANGPELWIGTFEHGLDIMDIKTGKVVRHYNYGTDSNSLGSNFIVSFLKTRRGEILVATTAGLYKYNQDRKNFSLVQIPSREPLFIYSVIEDHEGNILIGTLRNGLFILNKRTGKICNFTYNPSKKNSLNSNRVNGIFESSDNTVWLATEGGGLCRFNRRDSTFTSYTTAEGFPSNFVFRVKEDSAGKLWISTSRGLVRLNPKTGHLKVYTRSNGLLTNQFNYNSAFRDSSTGYIYFGSVKGLIRFNPDSFSKDTFIPPVFITGFEVYNKELEIGGEHSPLKKSLLFTDTIVLSYNQSSFNIRFAALSYTSPDMTEYAYKLEGLDNRWTHLKSNRQAYFTEVNPGTYTFRVRAANSSGIWTRKSKNLVIVILPPWWQSPLARFFYFIAVLGAVVTAVRYYHSRVKEKNRRRLEKLTHQKEKEVYQAKIDFFTNVAHEIRTPLTLIKGPMEKIIRKSEEVPAIKKNLLIMERNTERLLELTDQLLDFRKVETNGFSLSFVNTDIVALLADVVQRFRPGAEQKKMRLKFSHGHLKLMADIDAEAFTKIMSNLISNAIKYGEKQVIVSLESDNEHNRFFVKVKSDGSPIPAELREKVFETFYRVKRGGKQSGTGLGLALSRSLAELMKGSLSLGETENNMNVFILTLHIENQEDQKGHAGNERTNNSN